MKDKLDFVLNHGFRSSDNENYYNRSYHGSDHSVIEVRITMANDVFFNLAYDKFNNPRKLNLSIEPINTKEEEQHNERFKAVDKVLRSKTFPSAIDILSVLDEVDKRYKK